MSTTEDTSAARRGSGSNDLLGAASEAHKLTDRQIEDLAFAVLREHNDDRLWRALTYDRGPYDVTTPSLALCHLARVFFAAGVAAALAGCVDMVQPPDIAVAADILGSGWYYLEITGRYRCQACTRELTEASKL